MRAPSAMRELDARLEEIERETVRRLSLVAPPAAAGDWPGLINKHREMLAILELAQRRRKELSPPADRAEDYWMYLAAIDRHLRCERLVLDAAHSRDFDVYARECRLLAAAVGDVILVGCRVGLRSAKPTAIQRERLRLTLPVYVVRALWRVRRDRAAGRSWRST